MAAVAWKMFDNALMKCLDGTIDLDTDSFRAVLLDSDYLQDLTDTPGMPEWTKGTGSHPVGICEGSNPSPG